MRDIKIIYLKPGWYKVEEKGAAYHMELNWLSKLQNEIPRYNDSKNPIKDWYNNLDVSSRNKIIKMELV
jgi:hypothetical protein